MRNQFQNGFLVNCYNVCYNVYKNLFDLNQTMKTERTTILTTPEFKAYLFEQASKQGISVSEYVRIKCSPGNTIDIDEMMLAELVKLCRESTKRAHNALDKAHDKVNSVLSEINKLRSE